MIHHGDNLTVLRTRIPAASVDLVYLDPPFQSGKDYGAFEDRWTWGPAAQRDRGAITTREMTKTVDAIAQIVGEGPLLAYLCMMAPRIEAIVATMKPAASLYLHCDTTASPYLRILLDAALGPDAFRNEVVWRYRRWPTKARRFQRMHDVLLFYARGAYTFHPLHGIEALAESTLKTFGTKKQRADFSAGHRQPGQTEEETPGPPLSDVWEVGVLAPSSNERTGYPTQKPEALLERVIRASSNPGDTVLDPFCGSGTTLAVAERYGRKFIGIDVNLDAVVIARGRTTCPFCDGSKTVRCVEPLSVPVDYITSPCLCTREGAESLVAIAGR